MRKEIMSIISYHHHISKVQEQLNFKNLKSSICITNNIEVLHKTHYNF